MPQRSLFQVLTLWTYFVWANPDARRLYDNLLTKNYNKLIRPVGNSAQTLVIRLGMKLTQIIDVDEKNEIIALNMWVIHEWEDINLRWSPEEYGNVSSLNIPSESIWLPDIVLYNNADGDYTITMMTKATIHYNGLVRWEPPAIFKSQCEINVEYFPFDQQLCKLKFGSWSYDGTQVDLKHLWHEQLGVDDEKAIINPGMDLKHYYRSVEWDLLEVPARKNIKHYPCCSEPYPDVTFNLTLRRQTVFYTINLIIPCASITMLTVLGFYLPSDCGEKISLCISLLLSLSLFQLLLLEIIPPTSVTMPLIGKYILFTTVVVTLSVLSSVLVLNANFRSPTTHELPRWIKRTFLDILPKLLFMKKPKVKEEEDMDFRFAQSDLSNYENPYKKKFRPLHHEESKDDLCSSLNYSSTFVGFENNVDMTAFCQACSHRELKKKYPANAQKAFDGVMFIAWHMKEARDHHDNACNIRQMKKLPVNAIKALDGVCFIAKHLKDDDCHTKVKEDWKYVAMVIDRMLLWVYSTVCFVGSACILMNAPSLFDNTEAIDTPEQ